MWTCIGVSSNSPSASKYLYFMTYLWRLASWFASLTALNPRFNKTLPNHKKETMYGKSTWECHAHEYINTKKKAKSSKPSLWNLGLAINIFWWVISLHVPWEGVLIVKKEMGEKPPDGNRKVTVFEQKITSVGQYNLSHNARLTLFAHYCRMRRKLGAV